ncbi:chromosome-associated kinesin KIF4-like [Planoprotostelium fungivorum]|uniref:Kinesin-like protein n=1 Tax=Planoprotostelium fungivorum TaxID=1890364 RepID=A0A2P6NIG7_9EUKA|nr:chromosome-associated kinesin KIF4-like [Planoprotostelium fungivorum]
MVAKEGVKDLIPVQVAVRVRPLSDKENRENAVPCLRVVIGKDRAFTYDFIFPADKSQESLYQQCVIPLLDSCLEGYNSTILAYGQTGSGKTYTMGTNGSKQASTENLGIIPRVIRSYKTYVSFLELYNEEIRDMLNPSSDKPLSIREDNLGVFVNNLSELEVTSGRDMEEALVRGSLSRTVGSTQMNTESSRSHAIFTLILQRADAQDPSNTVTSRLHFVDLAGSERLSRTKAEGARMKEGISINGGLLALGNVISALGMVTKKKMHIPYRDSKLTRILQDSLGGNSRTLMIACCSPSDTNLEETLNTLKYADRARQIKNKPILNVDPVKMELLKLRKQVLDLTRELMKYKESETPGAKVSSFQENFDKLVVERLEDKMRQLAHENNELNQSLVRNEKKYRFLLDRTVNLEQKYVWENNKSREEVERLIQSGVSNQLVDNDDRFSPQVYSRRMSTSRENLLAPLTPSKSGNQQPPPQLMVEHPIHPTDSSSTEPPLSSQSSSNSLREDDDEIVSADHYDDLISDYSHIQSQADELLNSAPVFDLDELLESSATDLGSAFTDQLIELLNGSSALTY